MPIMACPTCKKSYTTSDMTLSLCSNGYHCCRECTWKDGVVVTACLKCLRYAPDGQVWVCGACGKTEKDRYGSQDGRGWDESCMMHAVLCYDQLPWVAVT